MKKKLSFSIFATLMAALLVFSGSAWAMAAQDDDPATRGLTPDEYGIITGRITDVHGVGVADARIEIWDERGFGAGWDLTDHNGKYEITLPAANYKIWFIPPEGVYLAPAFIADIEVTVGQTITVDVTLEAGGLISGRVTDEAGVGVAGAWVSVWDPATGAHGWAHTDDQGNYTTTGLGAVQ